jgi:hypothetical protein
MHFIDATNKLLRHALPGFSLRTDAHDRNVLGSNMENGME